MNPSVQAIRSLWAIWLTGPSVARIFASAASDQWPTRTGAGVFGPTTCRRRVSQGRNSRGSRGTS